MIFLFVGAFITLVAGSDNSSCRTVGATCKSCTSVNLCVAPNSSYVVYNCERPTPYCNAGTCSSVPGGKECLSKFDKFACPEEDGTYPDGNNCRMYHVCLNGTSHPFHCTIPNSVYSPSTKSCVRQSKDRSCNLVRCWRENGFVPYPDDDSLYFLCVNSKPTIIQRCPKGLRYDQASQSCVMACHREGRFPDPAGNSSIFIECTLTMGSSYKTVKRICPGNSTLEPTTLQCSLNSSSLASDKGLMRIGTARTSIK